MNKHENVVNTLDNLKNLLKENQELDLNMMNAVWGGDGEDNGGADIIIPIPFLRLQLPKLIVKDLDIQLNECPFLYYCIVYAL
jgi:hypothetical protein